MNGLRFDDIERMVPVSIGFGIGYLGFVSSLDDIEVWFQLTDFQGILATLEKGLASNVHEGRLFYRFDNRGGDDGSERAAFLVREHFDGIEITLVSGLEESDDLSGLEMGGMSVCISKSDARTLMNDFSRLLNSSLDPADRPTPGPYLNSNH
ncbi:hypothetical protein ACFPT7_18625 [Acidicapsa dinghuensis]|uniref:Uncharacterized protein n=1 Tax=Acidicapsa dinghuensis TaxID=2218256 RepID=A0ABW1EMZ9_9BACT|nr:hypothetical protein [Acidicapsa dinghuensis]